MLNVNAKLTDQFSRGAYINIGLIIVISLLATVGIQTLSRALDRSELVLAAMRNHMFADMMHDGIRADVFAMYKAASERQEPEMKAVEAGFREHQADFRKAIADNQALDLPAEMKAALAEVDEPLETYLRHAETVIAAMHKDFDGFNHKRLDEFADAFDDLADNMEKVSDKVEALTDRENRDHAFWSLLALVSTLVIGAAALFWRFICAGTAWPILSGRLSACPMS